MNKLMLFNIQLFAHKKGQSSTSNGRDSAGRRLGAKASDGEFVTAGPPRSDTRSAGPVRRSDRSETMMLKERIDPFPTTYDRPFVGNAFMRSSACQKSGHSEPVLTLAWESPR